VSGSGFGSGLAGLVEALNTNLDWIRDHTRLCALSERWQTRKRDVALLLRGDELEDAERWLARKPPKAPEPPELLRAFVAESRRAEAARLDKERQDAKTATEIAVLRGHGGGVTSAAFSPDGLTIVTASWDKTARVWDAHLLTMSAQRLLAEACAQLTGQSRLTRDEMRLIGSPDSIRAIDVCQ
jgi:hypothetical protein